MHSKTIGKYTLVAEDMPKLQGYFTPQGASLKKEQLWKDDVFYEQDYFAISTLTNLHVVDDKGVVCTPIIKQIEVENSGYVLTMNMTFWVQGFAIVNGEIFFISKGEEQGYYRKLPEFHKWTPINIGKAMTYDEFIRVLPPPIDKDSPDNVIFAEWWDGTRNLSDYMLL